jgi:hypothetical protein
VRRSFHCDEGERIVNAFPRRVKDQGAKLAMDRTQCEDPLLISSGLLNAHNLCDFIALHVGADGAVLDQTVECPVVQARQQIKRAP